MFSNQKLKKISFQQPWYTCYTFSHWEWRNCNKFIFNNIFIKMLNDERNKMIEVETEKKILPELFHCYIQQINMKMPKIRTPKNTLVQQGHIYRLKQFQEIKNCLNFCTLLYYKYIYAKILHVYRNLNSIIEVFGASSQNWFLVTSLCILLGIGSP